ncbi:MAG: hypothetical protein ACLPWS_05170 [Rhodomicrobium sp.]
MYIDLVPNRGSKPAILLRESIREGKRVRKRTIANLSALTLDQAEAISCVLKGEGLAPTGSLQCIRSLAHGHVEAVLTAMKRLGFDKLIDGNPARASQKARRQSWALAQGPASGERLAAFCHDIRGTVRFSSFGPKASLAAGNARRRKRGHSTGDNVGCFVRNRACRHHAD